MKKIFLILIALVLIGVVAYVYVTQFNQNTSPTDTTMQDTLPRNELPRGALILGLFDTAGEWYPTTFELRLPDSRVPFPVITGAQAYTAHINYEKTRSVFAAIPEQLLQHQYGTSTRTQLFTMDPNYNVQQITNSDTYYKVHPEWASNGTEIAFMAHKTEEEDGLMLERPDTWTIYITDLEGNEEEIVSGMYPQWSPDGSKLVYVDTDGIKVYDRATKTSTTAITAIEPMTRHNKIDVSKDGTKLVVSYPNVGEIEVLNITSWEPFAYTNANLIQKYGLGVVFSPDAHYLAVHEVDPAEPQDTSKLMVYELGTGRSLMLQDLSMYDRTRTYVTDWVYRPR